jgi:hypothetical protein
MRYLLPWIFALAVPFAALAQGYSHAPIIVEAAPPASANLAVLPPSFPDWAVTKAGENTTGQQVVQPAAPANPANPTTPAAANAAATPATPTAPPSPESPASKLWPRDTVPIFMQSCVGFHPELVSACSCVITHLMPALPHDEFLRETADDTIEKDPRVIDARMSCVGSPHQRSSN